LIREKLRKMKVLLVEVDSNEPCHMQEMFSDKKNPPEQSVSRITFDFDLIATVSKETAIASFKSIHPDLVVIDLAIGQSASKKLCQTIRKLEGQRHTGIVFYSKAEEHDSTSVECLELGADDFVRHGCSPRESLARINAVLRLKAMTDELRSTNHKLHQLSYTDELTGLSNMRAFNGTYSGAIKECHKNKYPIGVIMMDLDYFKNVNDTTNHLMGSHVISEVGKIISGSGILGSDDCAARFGGDEYIILTKDKALEIVRRKAEEIRKIIEEAIFIKDQKSVRITTSCGVAWVPSGYEGKAEDPIKAADMMLYKSKGAGRNCVRSIILRDSTDFSDVLVPHFLDWENEDEDDGEDDGVVGM